MSEIKYQQGSSDSLASTLRTLREEIQLITAALAKQPVLPDTVEAMQRKLLFEMWLQHTESKYNALMTTEW
jgi:hypothetical protein